MGYETRVAREGGSSVCPAGSHEDTELLTAKDVMQYGVVSIDRKQPVYRAVSLLLEKGISGLVVTDEGRLSGMLSERDLLRLMHKTEYLPGLVEDYMSPNVTSFDVEDRVTVICRHLVESSFRHAPITYERRLAGMITRADLIRAYKERFRPPAETSGDAAHGELLAEDVMRYGLLTVQPDTSLYDAMDMIARHHVTGLPVVDEAMRLLGIITETDVLLSITHPVPVEATVEAFMTTDVIAFHRKTRLDEICACLIEKDFHRVPILDGDKLVGIISRSDILRKRASVFKLRTGCGENAGPCPPPA